jgi:GNAT superfamily N-acetyltransferase
MSVVRKNNGYMMTTVQHFTAESPGWLAYVAHLKRVDMRHGVDNQNQPKDNCYYLGVSLPSDTPDEMRVIGHIALCRQPLHVPASHLTDNQPRSLTLADNTPLYEMFVESFAVETQYRRKGYGRALQIAAIQVTQDADCYQMRSWSSADRTANYALKLSLGFSVHPALYPMPGVEPISGVYFIWQTHASD